MYFCSYNVFQIYGDEMKIGELLKAGNPVPAIFTGDGKNPCKTPEAGTGGCTRTARGL